METATGTFDYDALVAPIETAGTVKDARTALWAVLRDAGRYFHWSDKPLSRDIVAAVDAAAWQAGISFKMRRHAILQTVMYSGMHVCDEGAECDCLDGGIEQFYRLIPEQLGNGRLILT